MTSVQKLRAWVTEPRYSWLALTVTSFVSAWLADHWPSWMPV